MFKAGHYYVHAVGKKGLLGPFQTHAAAQQAGKNVNGMIVQAIMELKNAGAQVSDKAAKTAPDTAANGQTAG